MSEQSVLPRETALPSWGDAAGEPSDGDLLARIARRDPAAFACFYDRHAAAAYGLALRIMREPEQASDVVQDAFLACWRQADGFEARRGNARAWLLAIIHHRAVDLLRSARQRHEIGGAEERLAVAPSDLSVEQEALRRLDRARIQAALACLPAEQRQIVVLAYFEGYRYPEIAALLRLPLGTVKSRLRLALAHLSRVLDTAERCDAMPAGEGRIVSLPAARLARERRALIPALPAFPSARPSYAAR